MKKVLSYAKVVSVPEKSMNIKTCTELFMWGYINKMGNVIDVYMKNGECLTICSSIWKDFDSADKILSVIFL